jgi:hypothetical protein
MSPFSPGIDLLTKFHRPRQVVAGNSEKPLYMNLSHEEDPSSRSRPSVPAPTNSPSGGNASREVALHPEGKLVRESLPSEGVPLCEPFANPPAPTAPLSAGSHSYKAKPVHRKLSPEDEYFVEAALKQHDFSAKVAREHVGAEDIRRLKPRGWVNDEIVNFYGALIMARAERHRHQAGKAMNPDVYIFSSFFWAKLNGEGYKKAGLDRWTRRVSSCPNLELHLTYHEHDSTIPP